MKKLQRIAFIGNHLPRRCGIATFTHDLHRAVAETRPDLDTCVVAMNDPGRTYRYPKPVRIELRDDVVDDYLQTAKFLNRGGVISSRCNTSTGSSAGPPVVTSSSFCRALICRLSRRFILSFRTQILTSAM
ncbi:hypothetical protein ACO2I3_06130 [Leptospira interrogans]